MVIVDIGTYSPAITSIRYGDSVLGNTLRRMTLTHPPFFSRDLSNNRLTESVNESVAHLPALRDLRLKRNRLQAMPVFQGLPNVDKLTLAHNLIESVSAEAVAALPRLEHLDLSKNRIKVLAAPAFPAGNILKVVNLEANLIEDIHRNALSALVQVTDLKLKGNHLASVTAETFQRMRQLKKL